jgi:hypothetical protein
MTMDCAMNATFSINEIKRDRQILATLVKEEEKTLKIETPTSMLMKENKKKDLKLVQH